MFSTTYMQKTWVTMITLIITGYLPCAWSADILIGQTADYSGVAKSGVLENWRGAKLWLDEVNSKGGIYGEKIRVIQKDDVFDPKLAASNARDLIEIDKVLALFLVRGTPHTEAVLPVLEQYNVPLIAPSTGAMSLVKPFKKHIFNVRPSYQYEAEKTIEQLTAMNLTKIALVYQEDSFGKDALIGYEKGFNQLKIKPVFVEKFDRQSPSFGATTAQALKWGPNAIIFVGASATVAQGIDLLRKAGWAGIAATLSNNASDGFVKLLGKNSAGVIVSQVFPDKRYEQGSLVQEMSKLMDDSKDKDKGVNVSPSMVEGFAAAKVLVQALKNAGHKPTRERLFKSLNALNMNVGNLKLSYTDKEHAGLNFAELSVITEKGTFKR